MNAVEDTNKQEFSNMVDITKIYEKYKYILLSTVFSIIVVIYLFYQIGLASNDPKAFTKNFTFNIFAIVVPTIGVLALILLTTLDKDYGVFVLVATLFIVAVFGIIFYFLQTNLSRYIFNKYLFYAVLILIIIIGLSIVYTLFAGTLRRTTGWIGFFSNLFFYIPCLIRDAISGAISEYKTFSNTLTILFIMEIVLILMYFFLIPFTASKVMPKSISLLSDPIMLNTPTPLDTSSIDLSNNSFGLSMWVYINPAPRNKLGYSHPTTIFTYANSTDIDASPHIKLSYGENEKLNLIVDIANSTTGSFETYIPLQKWHNIVFNYVSGTSITPTSPSPSPSPSPTVKPTTVDVFINGSLAFSTPLITPSPLFSKYDTITVGSGSCSISDANVEGLYGAICNILYYPDPITKMALVYTYNLLTIRNPPL